MEYKTRIKSLLEELNKGLYERKEIMAITLLSALAEQNIFLYGPPGTAKSLISRRLSKAFDIKSKVYFEHLMQKFSTPEEVFGPISITELKQDNYVRKTNGFLPEAEFAFLDEIWKSSPAILNTLLTIINEKKFKNGTEIKKVPLKVLISASNEIPAENQGLDALYDRFLTRLLVPPIEERYNFEAILQNGSSSDEIDIPDELLIKTEEFEEWKAEINNIKLSKDTLNIINGIKIELASKNEDAQQDEYIYVSDRRWQKVATLLKASAFFSDRRETNIADCLLLSHCLWTKPENREEIQTIVEETVKTSGFTTEISLQELQEKKDDLEKEITEELYYSSDVYKTVRLSIKKHQEFFKCTKKIRNSDSKTYTFYIPTSEMKGNNEFNPVDESGNELKWIKCNFNGQGSCSVKIEDKYQGYNFRKTETDFTPKVLFHKGDKKTGVNNRLIDSFKEGIASLNDKLMVNLEKVRLKKQEFEKKLDTPFLSEKQLEITLTSITRQIEDLHLQIKDCERIENLI